MAYSVGKAIRELGKKINSIYFLSGDDYFLQNFWRYSSVVRNSNKHLDKDNQIFVTKFTYYLPSIWGHKVDGFEPSLAFPLLV